MLKPGDKVLHRYNRDLGPGEVVRAASDLDHAAVAAASRQTHGRQRPDHAVLGYGRVG